MAVAFGLVLALLAAYLVVHRIIGRPSEGCTVRAADGSGALSLNLEQGRNASTVAAVAQSRGLPDRAVTIALATAMQESRLENITHGDRDSLGLFQQRPSQGWGTVRQVQDPVYATGRFFDGLVKVPGYTRLPLTVAAQRVQRSGHPQAYAKHEADAATLAAALLGREGGVFSCVVDGDDTAGHPGGGALKAAVAEEFGGAGAAGVARG
ncbi:hypothetical protein BIV57_15740, partial [Mangrovactinospora gilvigrisea]